MYPSCTHPRLTQLPQHISIHFGRTPPKAKHLVAALSLLSLAAIITWFPRLTCLRASKTCRGLANIRQALCSLIVQQPNNANFIKLLTRFVGDFLRFQLRTTGAYHSMESVPFLAAETTKIKHLVFFMAILGGQKALVSLFCKEDTPKWIRFRI